MNNPEVKEIFDVSAGIKDACEDRAKYMMYKLGETRNINIDEMKIISVLENLGFPLDEDGTYLYKTVIMNVIAAMGTCDQSDLSGMLNNRYDSFYQQIAREDYFIGVKNFHNIICKAINKIDSSKVNEELSYEIFENSKPASYGTQALRIANYMVRQDTNESETGKVKVKIVNE